jgi:Fe-S cluster biogenesis protein NfuA
MFIQTETTPNPESLKYIPGEVVLDEKYGTGMYFRQGDSEVNRSPLAKKLLKIPGVLGVFLGRTFITITKSPEIIWQVGPVRTDVPYSRPLEAPLNLSHTHTPIHTHTHTPPTKNQNLSPEVFATVMDHYAEGGIIVSDEPIISDTTILDTDDEVVAMIKELMESRIRPAVQEDGGDIFYMGFAPETGIVSVRLAGSCSGCPSSSVTLKNGVENMLMHYIPEVSKVQGGV